MDGDLINGIYLESILYDNLEDFSLSHGLELERRSCSTSVLDKITVKRLVTDTPVVLRHTLNESYFDSSSKHLITRNWVEMETKSTRIKKIPEPGKFSDHYGDLGKRFITKVYVFYFMNNDVSFG